MKKRVLVLVGTKKGAFILEGDAGRKSWELRGPYLRALADEPRRRRRRNRRDLWRRRQ